MDYPLDLGAFFVDKGSFADFANYTGNQTLPLKLVPNTTEFLGLAIFYVWNNYTYWDFLNEYIAPSR